MMLKYLDIPQAVAIKRAIWALIVLIVVWLFASKRITLKKIKKFKMMVSMALQMMKN